MGAEHPIDVQIAILYAEMQGMDDNYARMQLERIAMLAERAIHLLPDTHHARFIAILRQARGGH